MLEEGVGISSSATSEVTIDTVDAVTCTDTAYLGDQRGSSTGASFDAHACREHCDHSATAHCVLGVGVLVSIGLVRQAAMPFL